MSGREQVCKDTTHGIKESLLFLTLRQHPFPHLLPLPTEIHVRHLPPRSKPPPLVPPPPRAMLRPQQRLLHLPFLPPNPEAKLHHSPHHHLQRFPLLVPIPPPREPLLL